MSRPERKPYTGTSRRLLLGIDIGTTFSGVSYSILDPGHIPEIKHVTRFPAQTRVGADSKIPSIVWYDSTGEPRAFGGEAIEESIISKAHDEQWIKVEWFKLGLAKSADVQKVLPPLPPGKSIVSIFADFLKYLYHCAATYITETHPQASSIMSAGDIHFVLSHPNAWEGHQQSQLRQAVAMAGLISESFAEQERLQFVTEGEASLHFCLQQGLDDQAVRANKGILIIDAGGGTIDLSTYAPVSFNGTTGFEEIALPHCQFNGSVFVSLEARKHLSAKLKGSKFADDINEIVKCFDTGVKLCFRNSSDPYFVQFGRIKDNEPAYGIRNGQLILEGEEVAAYFGPSVKSIIDAVTSIGFDAAQSISTAFLVGGFAASYWLYNKLQEHFEPLGIKIHRPDAHVNKAVSDGAMGYYIDHHVSVRVARHHYGAYTSFDYRAGDPAHLEREHKSYIALDGVKSLRDGFSVLLKKHAKVSESEVFRKSYIRLFAPWGDLEFKDNIYQYIGLKDDPIWTDVEEESFVPLCTVEMSSQTAYKIAQDKISHTGKAFRQVPFDILLHFGLTEFQAQYAWMENGVEQRSPAKIIYPDAKAPVIYSNFKAKAKSESSDTEDDQEWVIE